MDDNIKKLHQALIDDGYDDVGTEQEFRDYVSDSKNVATLYNALSEAGYDNFKDQKSLETYLSAKAPVAQKPSTPQSSGQSVSAKEKKQTQYPQEVIDAFNSPDNKPGNFKDLAQLNDEYQRGELKKPGIISQALGMFSNVDAGNIGKEQKVGGMIANMLLGDNMQQPHDNNQQVQQPSQKEASPESREAAPVTTPTGVVNNEGLMDAKLANYLENWKQRPDKQGDYFENMVADLLADGTANSNEEAVSMVQSALGRYANRSAMDVTNQVVSSLPDDTVQDAEKSIEAQWYSHGVQDKLKQEADSMGISYDDYVALFLKPAMVQSLVNKYGPNYRNIAEGIATRLYSHDENVQDRLMNQDINDALSSVISKYVNPSVVDEYNKAQEAGSKAFTEGMEGSQFIPANLRLGTALGAQYEANEAKDPAKVLSSLQMKFGRLYRNPEFLNDMSNAAFKVMQRYGLNGTQSSDPKQFKPMINSVLKNELDQLEIKGMMPKGSAEYIMKTGLGNTIVGKITRKAVQTDYQNWLEDIANQQYQPGFWENVASGALTFAGDAWSYWLPGAAGGKLTKSMVAKAEGKLAGDLMAKGMERRVAERAAKVLIGKSKAEALKSGAAHGAVTFGGQSAISKPIDETYRTGQFDENGKIYNPSGWKIALDTLLEGTQQSALGVIMQGNTIANMLGKGRGLATNILADIGGKVVDSGIMTGHQILERMAQDPNFKPTGKDAAETFLESGANLLSIGFPGFVGKYARFKDAREFNKKFDFTDQDIAELKRFGYDGLRDAFEKVGIGEYAVVGENAQRLDGQLTKKYMDLMNDKSVPEVLKAKMMAVVEGKRPSSFSPIVDSIIVQPMDNGGKVYLETLNKDGDIVERKEFSSLDEAQKADKKLEYEKTLGLASVLEGEFHNEFTQEHLDGLYNKAAQKYNMGEKLKDEDKAAVYLHQNAGAIKEIMDKQQKGIILTDEEQKQVNTYRHYYDSALENSSVMREFVNTFEDSHGVARGTLRKALESKDKKYAPLVESYLKELYNSIELKREMKQTMDDLYNTSHGNEQKRIEQSGIEGEKPATPVEGAAPIEGSASVEASAPAGGQEPPVSAGLAPYQDRTNSVPSPNDANSAANVANSSAKVAASDAFVMGQNAYKNGDSEALQAIDYNSDLATGRLKRAFADNEKMPDIVANAYSEGKDMDLFVAQRASSLTPAQKEAISKYVEAMDAKNGAIDALQHADDGYGEALKQQLWPYQTEDGNIVPATLDSGKQVFLKKANEYGGAFVVVPDEQGQPMIKQVSNAEIREVGTPVSLDEYIESSLAQQKEARAQQFISQFDGSGLKPNDQVTVAMEEGDANINMTFAGYSKDGKIVLTDGKDYLPLSKEEFAAWRKNALDNTINEHLDAEDDEREQKAASQAEADKKQRYANGIVGLSEGQPDYSSNDTDPNVAAEYLQEQFGEDHGKLLNLVNGSRDDIKTQLANKRKAAIEYQNWLDTNADLDPEKAKKVEDELSLVNEQIADLDARFKNWNTIRNSVMTPDEVKAMKEERKAEVEKAGVDESAIVPSDDFHVLVLEDEELKKQYPTMDKATDYITSQRKDIYHTQEDVERKINGVNDMLDQYINGETELAPSQLMELNTTKAQLEALQTNLSVAAKGLKAQANKLSRLYKTEVSKQEMEKLGMTPSEQLKALVADALKKNDMNAIHDIYKDASVDVMDLTPQTLEEAVSESLLPHSLNPESLQYELGKSNFKFGIGKRYDSNKFNYLIAKKGTGMSVNEFAVRVYNDLPVNLQDMGYTDQDVRNALLDMFKSYDSVKEMRNVVLMNRIAAAEDELSSEEEYYEAQKEREIIERQAEIEQYKSYIHEKELSLPSESELDHINGLEFDRMMEIEDREREYKQYVKSILPELADYDDRSNEEGYGGGSSLGSDSSRRGVDERNSQGEEVGNGEASSESEIGEGSDSGRKGRQETGSMEPGKGSAVRGSHLPQETSFGERLKSAIAETETEITEAQKKAGNYKKGHLSFGGYDYTVETPKGVTRSGKDEQGKPWSVTMHDTYGYILGKIGVDGDHIDMFINDAADLDTFDGNVYVVDQVNPETGEFDEHKVMYGYPSEEAATEAYLANYSKGWKGLGKVTAVPKATFDKWLESSDRKTKPFAEYAMVQKEQRAAYEEGMMQDGAHSEAFDKIVDLAKEQKEYWDLMVQGEVDPNEVSEVDVAHEMDELLKTLSDEEFKEVSDVLQNIDEEFEYFTADEYERREDLAERKNAAAYSEFLKQKTKSIAPFADTLRNAVNSGDKKAIAKAQKELNDALLASNLGHGYLSRQLEYAKSAKKKDESYSERRAFIKPLTDAINAIESALDSALADVGLEGVHVDFREYGYGWIYADKGSDWRDRLEPLDNDYRNVSQYSDVNPISVLPQITMNNVKKVAGIIKSRIEEGERYNSYENQDENIEEAKKTKDNLPFHRDVKEVKPENLTEAQKVAYDAVSTMLKKAGIPVKVVNNEDMEKVAEAQDNMAVEMLLNDPRLRFYIKTPEQKEAAKAAYDWAAGNRPDKFKQYAIVNMDNPNQPPQYFEKKDLAEKWRKYYTNAWKIVNYKAFNLNKPFEEQIKDVKGDVPSEFDPYKADAQNNKKNELKRQIKETEDAYNSTGQERNKYQIQLMKEYMDEHGLASEDDIPYDVWSDLNDKAHEKYQDKLDSLFAKYKELDRELKAVAEPGVRFLRTYHGSGASFDKFDLSHALEGEGSETFGHGVYVTSSREIGREYAQRAKQKKMTNLYKTIRYPDGVKGDTLKRRLFGEMVNDVATGGDVKSAKEFAKKRVGADANDVQRTLEHLKDREKGTEYEQNLKDGLAKYKDALKWIDSLDDDYLTQGNATRYEVEIPEDNGSNYIDWENKLKKSHLSKVNKELVRIGKEPIETIYPSRVDGKVRGQDLYDELSSILGSKEAASKLLSDAGFVGIKYPAGTIYGGAKEGDYNYVIFDENNAQIVDHTKFAQGKGVVYGYTDGKEIVLNAEHLNPNTPIHEYQHLWRTAAKKMNPELIEHGDKLIMQTQLFADLKQDPNYNHLTDEQICDEAFARLTGEDGAAILEQMAKDAIKENPLDTAKGLSVINKLKEWLKKFWYWTLDTFTKWKPEDIKKMTLEDIRNLVLRDLANGVDPRTKLHEAENADDIKFMGSTTKKRMKDISTQLEGRELDEAQQAVADVYSGKKDNVSLTVEREDGSNKIIMRQGNDNHAGTKHSVFRHYGVKANSLNADDLLLIPTVLKEGERKVSDNGRVAYVYVDPTSQVKYTVVTEPKNNKEFFNDFYSNKKANPSETSRVVENSTNTPEGAHNNDGNAFMDAKVDNNSETAKGNGENLSVEDKIKAVSQQFGVDEADVAMYANAVKKGSTAEAARARANIKRHLLQANEDKISSFKELLKYTVPVNEALKENFGDVDAMIEERKQQMEAQRNAMEAARKRAEEEEAKRQKHLEELSLIPDDQLDKQYMDALAKGDDATAREMLDEAARRKGYDDTESAYQGVGAWAAPGNPGYESDKARREDWESSGSDVNLEDMAMGYTPQPDDYFSHPERYSQNTPHGLESVKAISAAIDAIKNGEKDVKVKVYRAVPTSVKEGKLRNGDWVTPSKKYAEMHGTNRLDGKYRIIEDEVPATQLWWDGNDANEFGFDDGKEYKYKNAKNNRKLNDLVTYDDEGDVIPPSKRFNSRKSDIRFMFAGEKGATEADKAEEKTYRMDNLKVAEKMERGKKDAKAIKLATGWERGADGKWRYEMPDAKIKDMKDIGGGNIVKRFDDDMLWNDGKLADVIDAPGLFEAYPQLKDVRIDTDAIMNDMPSNGEYNAKTNIITIHADELKYMNSILNHEIQHAIQHIEGFARGGSPRLIRGEVKKNDDYNSYKSLAGEVEARNVESRMGMTDEERRNSLAEETEDVNRDEQIVMNVGDTSYSIVKDPETIKKLDKEDTVKVYRAMQVGEDGKLYPPMAAKVKGKFVQPIELGKWEQADERPELADDKGMFTLNKGNGKSLKAAYNPYLHTSRTPLNDQFSEAQNRPNIVTVEVEVPKSELTSGYKADKAKDAVGEVEWKAGIIQGQLTGKRKVVLSRWDKPVRIVPDSEVADVIVNDMFKGMNITMPSNVVTPSLRKELEKRGVPFVETDNRGRIVGGENDGVHYSKVYGKNAQSPVLEQKLKKHPDSLMKAGTYFSGGGLVEEGLKGIIDPVVAVEYDRKISGVYRNNFGQHIVTADVRDVDPQQLVKHIDGEVEYFHASPVCKNYSQAKSNSGEVELDKETAKSTADFIDAVKPRVVTIENVKGYKDSEAMKIITQALDKNGYKWDVDVYNAADFGGYTSRERLIVRAVKDGELPEKPKKQPRKGGWLEAVEDILPTLTEKKSGVAPWMDARLKVDGIDWKKVEKPLYVMGSAYADGKIPHAYGNEILPTLRTKSGDVIIMPGGKVLRADGRVLARITGLGDDYLLPKTESLAHTIIGNGIPVQLTKGVIAPLLNKDDLSGRNVLARLGSSIFKNNWDADKQKQVSDRVVNTANKLGGAEATVYTSVDEVPDAYLSDVKNGATGWYDPTTHTVHVYLPNCADANEAERTVLHEKIGHEGMEVLLGGEDGVRKFANFVYNSVAASTRGKILDIANKYDPDLKNPDRMNVGTQEYIAHLAEEGSKTAEDFSLWTKIKHYLIKVLKKLGIRVPGLLNDKDLRYYLMKAGKALHVWDNMPKEKQEAMMKQASNAEIKDALSDGAGKGKPRQKKGESTIQYMKRVQEWRKWQNAREDKENPEPPMFYDIDKDEAGKKEWAQLNKDWRERHHLVGEEPTGMPIRMENEEDDAYMNRIHEYEKWQAAMKDQEDPLPDMFAFEKKKQEEVKRKYEDWLAKHDLLEQQQADLDLYEGKIYPAETNPKADALEQQVMQDLAEVTSTDVSKEGAARSVHDAVIYRRKNIESASADDAIFINSVKQDLNKIANTSYLGRKADAIADAIKETVTGKSPKTLAKKMAEAIPYIIEAPRRMRDIADEMNAVGAFENGHIHVTAKDIDAIQPFTDELRVLASKSHKIEKDGKETIVYDDVPSMTEVASKMAKAINDNHVGEEGFVPVDGTDILAEHVLPVVLKRIVPEGVEYKNLSEEMQSLLDKIREWYDKTFTWLKDSHTVRADIGYTNDYVNHRWDKKKSDDKAYADLVEGRQRTKSPNEKPRKVSTYMEGVDAGLVPKTTDITDLLAYYSQSNIEAFANKTFLQELSGINVIERNKDGEITSSMPLLTSIQPKEMMVDENKYTPYVVPGINTVWVYNQGKIFNKSAEDWFNAAFGTVKLPKVLKGVKNAMSIAKTLELGFSGFHAGALTEVYAVQNSAEFGPAKAMAYFMKYLITDTAKNHQLPAFANPDVFKEAAKHLVKFGSASDYATADIENLYEKVHSYVARLHSKLVEGNVAMKAGSSVTFPLEVATELLKMSQKGLDVALWSYLHDGLKLATYQLRAERTRERAKKLNWNEDMLNKALDEDGQFVNDMFGGQHFDVLGLSKKMQTILDFIFLSKDWLISTTRHALSIFGYGSIWNEASIKNFMEYYKHVLGRGEMTKEDYLRLSRSKSGLLCYGIGFMIGYEGLSQLVNAAMRAWDEEKQKEKADEIRKTNPNYKSPYELAYPDGMHWYDYLMRGNSLGQQSKIFMGRYADGTEMYIRHGKQFREIPELFFDAKDNFAIPGPMVRRMYGKASPLLRGMIDTSKWYLSPDYGDKEMQRKYGENLGLIPKLGSYYVPFAVPTQKDKEFKMLDLVFPSSKGFSRYKAQDYFKTFIMSEDKQGLAMTYNACVQNGIDPEVQLKAAISSVKALEASEMSDGVTSLQEASKRFDAAKSITEKKKMRQKMKKFLSQSDYKAFTQKEALDMVQGYLNGDEDLKEMEKAESKYLMKAKAEDVTEDWRIQNVWNGTMETYQEYQRLKDVDKAKANAFKNSKTNKRLFAARKAISAAKKKMNKAKKQMDGTNDAAKLVEIRNTRKELLKTLNGME